MQPTKALIDHMVMEESYWFITYRMHTLKDAVMFMKFKLIVFYLLC